MNAQQQNHNDKMKNTTPFMAVHPGMMIKPELEERGISRCILSGNQQ